MTAPWVKDSPTGSGNTHLTPWTAYVASTPCTLWPYCLWRPALP